uniref:Uncharacterized protein n=1 Tax=Cacopsylla melanoneura TaxID=428564 RepID=A0A8D9DS22_9HEMI
MMTNHILLLSLLGFASVYSQTPCSHNVQSEPAQPEASNTVSKYEPVPAAQELLNREYLPPSDFAVPQANQAEPVYVAAPQTKLQPLPQPTSVKPVYQPLPSTVKPVYQPLPKLQPLPQATYQRPVVQPLPQASYQRTVVQPLPQATYVKPVVQPLPKLQPLPQATYVRPVVQPHPNFQPLPQATNVRPVIQPLPQLQPLPSTVQPRYAPQPLPKLQPFPSSPRPVITQTLPPSTLSPVPAPTFNRLPSLKPVQPFTPKQIVPLKTFQPRENEVQASNTVGVKLLPNRVPQATNVLPKVVRPDLETAAQTNRLNFINPAVNPDNIKINHYICEQGDPQQKFLCDILKLWDLNHPKEITSNDLDNPSDNSNFNPAFVTLPSSPRPTYAPLPSSPRPTYAPLPSTPRPTYAPIPSTPRPTYAPLPSPTTQRSTYAPPTTTTTTQEPENDILPGDSQQNENALYLPPYSTTPEPVYSTSPSTTVEIPKRVVAPSNNNINVITPDDTEISPSTLPYPTTTEATTTTTTTVAPKEEGYDYPKPAIPFPVPEKEGYDYPKPSVPFPVPEKVGYDYPKPAVSSFPGFPSFSTFSTTTPAPIFGSSFSLDGRYVDNLNQFSSGFSPLASFSDSIQYQPLVSTPAPVVTVAPEIFNSEYVSAPAFGYNYQPFQQSISSFNSPAVTYTDNSLSSFSPFGFSTPAPPAAISYTSEPAFFAYSTPAPPSFSYSSQPAFSQSLSTLAPLLLSKESLALTSTPAPPSINSFTTTTKSPADKSTQVSTEKPIEASTPSTPLPASFSSYPFGQSFNSFSSQLSPISYNSFPSSFGQSYPYQSFSSVSPLSYNFDNSLSSFNSIPYSGNSFSSISPLSGESFSTISPLSGQSYSTASPLVDQTSSTTSSSASPNERSTEKSTVATNVPAQPASGFGSQTFGSQSFGQVSNSLSPAFSYNFQPFEQRTNFTSFNFQPLPIQSFSAQEVPVSYNFQPLGDSFSSLQSYNFPSSFSSGLSQPQFAPPSGPALSSYPGSTPSPFNFQTPTQFDGSLSGQTQSSSSSQSSGSSSESQFGQGLSSPFPKSGLSFSSNVQSVENLKDLQATAKTSDFELKSESYSQGGQAENNQFAATFSLSKLEEAPRRTGSLDGKEDISLGNIEILKVKRKSPKSH